MSNWTSASSRSQKPLWRGTRYGASDGLLFRAFRRSGMQRSHVGDATRAWAWIMVHVGDLWGPDPTKQRWVRVASLRAGRLVGSVQARILFL